MDGICYRHGLPLEGTGRVCPECAKGNAGNYMDPSEYPFLPPRKDQLLPLCGRLDAPLPDLFPPGNIHPTAIISYNCRYRRPELFKVGAFSVVDDWGYFSTQVEVGRGCHIGAGVNISGGPKRKVIIKDHSSVTYHSDIVCGSPDYSRQIVTIEGYGEEQLGGNVTFEMFTGAATRTIIFWDNVIPEGTVILAGAIVRPSFPFEPWSVYGIDPIRPHTIKRIMARDRDAVLRQAERAEKWMKDRGSAK